MTPTTSIQVRKVVNSVELQDAYLIRKKVFVEEQGVPAEDEYDEHDEVSAHFVAYDTEDNPCGTARWRETPHGIKLERFAVLRPWRGTGIGAKLLESVLHDIEEDPSVSEQKIYMHAQSTAVEFYRKFGFSVVGDEFLECGIRHFEMAR